MQANDVTYKLAHLVPCSRDYHVDNGADLVLNALLFSPGPETAAGVANVILDRLGCSMPRDHIAEKLDELHALRLIVPVKGGYILAHHVQTDLESRRKAFADKCSQVVDRWIASLATNYEQLSLDDCMLLTDDLWIYLNSLFLSHGVESLSFITETGLEPPVAVDAVVVPAVARRAATHLQAIEKVEFPKFLGSTDPDILRFLLDLIDRAIRYLSTVVDTDVLATLTHKFKGKILYLDSNTIYRLVNLQGPHRHEVMSSVVGLCKSAGFDLRVNHKTLDELRRRLRFDSATLRKFPAPTNLAAVGVRYLTAENYVSTYWQAAKTHRMSIEDFIVYYEHIDHVLEELGVTVEKQERQLSPHGQEMVTYWMSQLALYEDKDADYKKSMAALEHDAYNIALIDELATDAQHFLDTPAWFLTTDQALVRLHRTHHERKGKLPFCIMPAQLLQILRFTTASDGAYDRTFLGLFSRTFIPSGTGIPNEMIQEIIGRVAKYRGTPKLAESVLSDTLFVRRYKETPAEGDRDELVHDALLIKAKEMEEALQDHQEKLSLAQDKTAALQQAVSTFVSTSQEMQQTLNEQQAAFQDEQNRLREEVSSITQRLQASEAARQAADERERERVRSEREAKKRRVRWLQAAVVLILACVPLLVTAVMFEWGSSPRLWKTTTLTLPVIGLTAGSYWVFGATVGGHVMATIGLVFTILAGWYSMI